MGEPLPQIVVRAGSSERSFDYEGWRLEDLPERPGAHVVDIRLGFAYDFYALGVVDDDLASWSLLHLDSAVMYVDEIGVEGRGVRFACTEVPLGLPREKVLIRIAEQGAETAYPILGGMLHAVQEPLAFRLEVDLSLTPSKQLVLEPSGWSLVEEGRVVAVNPVFTARP